MTRPDFSVVNTDISNDGAQPYRRAAHPADDSGLTPVEIIIGVTLLAILSSAVVFQAFRFISRADDSAAQTSLNTAVTAAKGIRSLSVGGGARNFAAQGTAANQTTANAILALKSQVPDIEFLPWHGLTTGAASATSFGGLRDVTGDVQTVWVDLEAAVAVGGTALAASTPVNQSGTVTLGAIPAASNLPLAQVVRLGIKSVSGATFCSIIVAVSSDPRFIGTGYQSVDSAGTQSGTGADCGAAETTPVDIFSELPGSGTDSSLLAPQNTTYG